MNNIVLLVGGIGLIFLSFATMFDNRNPVFCTLLSIKFLCKKNSFLHKLFVHKESSQHPHSLLLVIPFFMSIINCSLIVSLFLIYWTFDINFIEQFMQSNIPFYIGTIMILLGFIYPIILIIINKYFEYKQNKLTKEEWKHLNEEWISYYEKLN